MAEIVNLRMARKRAARAENERTADENRIRHGLPKSEKLARRAEKRRLDSHLEGHRLDRKDGE